MSWLGGLARRPLALGLVATVAVGCFDSGDRPENVPPPPPGPAQVDLTVTYQRLDGFGASSAWTASNLSDAMADLFFSPTTGIGLSLLRVRINRRGSRPIVAINQGCTDFTQDFTVAGRTGAEVTPSVTSAGQQLAAQAPVPVTDAAFSATPPARSVTSFVGSFTP
jgi:O-glycosyl hydrolase